MYLLMRIFVVSNIIKLSPNIDWLLNEKKVFFVRRVCVCCWMYSWFFFRWAWWEIEKTDRMVSMFGGKIHLHFVRVEFTDLNCGIWSTTTTGDIEEISFYCSRISAIICSNISNDIGFRELWYFTCQSITQSVHRTQFHADGKISTFQNTVT